MGEIGGVPVEGVRLVEVEGQTLLVWRDGEEIRVLDGVCPHRGAALGLGCVEDGVISCPWHEWSFDLVTGRGITNPMACLETYEVRVRDGLIYIDLD